MSLPSSSPEQGDDPVRKVVVYELLSLDGVAEQPDEFFTDWDREMDENLGRVIATQDTVLLGRRTYDDWAEFWPTSDIEPFASFINSVEKFVATSTTPRRTWANTTVIDDGHHGHITRAGPAAVRHVLAEAAQVAIRKEP
jgi:dihydrofolate reductase